MRAYIKVSSLYYPKRIAREKQMSDQRRPRCILKGELGGQDWICTNVQTLLRIRASKQIFVRIQFARRTKEERGTKRREGDGER